MWTRAALVWVSRPGMSLRLICLKIHPHCWGASFDSCYLVILPVRKCSALEEMTMSDEWQSLVELGLKVKSK